MLSRCLPEAFVTQTGAELTCVGVITAEVMVACELLQQLTGCVFVLQWPDLCMRLVRQYYADVILLQWIIWFLRSEAISQEDNQLLLTEIVSYLKY